MQRGLAVFFAYVLAIVGIIGLLAGETQLFNFINIDITMDIVRLALAVVLFASLYRWWNISVSAALTTLGVVYLLVGVMAAFSASLFGMAPHNLSGFDVAWHWIAGIVALIVAAAPATADGRQSLPARDMAAGFREKLDDTRGRGNRR